jgi:triosephosphate isomerase
MGNWKMNGDFNLVNEMAKMLNAELFDAEVAIFPPFPYLHQARQLLKGSSISLGAQNVSYHAKGAFTGEVAISMLKETGARYVLAGHSERRQLYQEDDDTIAAKVKQITTNQCCAVLCIGETFKQRNQGHYRSVINNQLKTVLENLDDDELHNLVIAYEPVWAIGTGMTATPSDVQEIHTLIRKTIAELSTQLANSIRIVYGGSVKAGNARELFALPDVDGGLIGGACLDKDAFKAIINSAN